MWDHRFLGLLIPFFTGPKHTYSSVVQIWLLPLLINCGFLGTNVYFYIENMKEIKQLHDHSTNPYCRDNDVILPVMENFFLRNLIYFIVIGIDIFLLIVIIAKAASEIS